MDKELEEKTDSLKATGEEITDLRKKNKVLMISQLMFAKANSLTTMIFYQVLKSERDLLLKRFSSEQEIEA